MKYIFSKIIRNCEYPKKLWYNSLTLENYSSFITDISEISLLIKNLNGEFSADINLPSLQYFKNNININVLSLENLILQPLVGDRLYNLEDIVQFLQTKDKSNNLQGKTPNVWLFVCLLCLFLATSAGSERSFSNLRLTKTYLWSRMRDDRLNHLSILSTYKEETAKIDEIKIANEFVSKSLQRLRLFGKFTEEDFEIGNIWLSFEKDWLRIFLIVALLEIFFWFFRFGNFPGHLCVK